MRHVEVYPNHVLMCADDRGRTSLLLCRGVLVNYTQCLVELWSMIAVTLKNALSV